jgi:hypothetical protein
MRAIGELCAVFAASLGLCACGPHAISVTSDVSTRDMSIAIQVKNEGGPTRLRAQVDGKLPYTGTLVLSPGDRLVLRGEHEADPPIPFVQDPAEATSYFAETPRTSGTFVVDLLRDADRPLLGNEVAIPPPFTLAGPSGTISRKDPIALHWEGAVGEHHTSVGVSGACTRGLTIPLEKDTGEYVINGGEIPGPPDGMPDGCDVTVTVNREAPWVGTPILYTTASQSRSLVLRLLP